jgi:iron complex outermembrane receptor protein
VPGALSLTNALQNSKAVQPINEINDYARDIRSLRIANRTILPAAEGLLEFGVYGALKSLYHPIFQVIDQDSKEAGAYIRWSGDVGPVEWTLGANLGWGSVDAKQFINVGGHRGALTADSDQKSLNVEGYGEARFQVDDAWTLIAGAQVLRARRIYDNHRSPAANDRETFSSFSPKVGVLWEPVKETQVFANLSRSVEPPTFSELVQFPVVGFVPLDAQRAWTAEVGSRGESGRFTWDITGYWSWLKGEMLQFITNPTIPAATFNADKTTHRGIEAGAGVMVMDELALRLVYAFNDFRFRNDAQYGDNKIAGLPRHIARIEASYSHDCGLTLTPSVEWAMSRAYVDFANSMTTPRYAIFNLAASWRHEDGWRLYLDARNLANKHYVSDIGTVVNATTAPSLNVFYPGDGRSVYAGVVREF